MSRTCARAVKYLSRTEKLQKLGTDKEHTGEEVHYSQRDMRSLRRSLVHHPRRNMASMASMANKIVPQLHDPANTAVENMLDIKKCPSFRKMQVHQQLKAIQVRLVRWNYDDASRSNDSRAVNHLVFDSFICLFVCYFFLLRLPKL